MAIDILLAVLLIWGIYTGYRKGLLLAVFSFVAYLLGVLVALHFSYHMTVWLEQYFPNSVRFLPIISFIAVFLLVVISVILLAKLLEKVLKIIQLNFFNRLAGVAVYLIIVLIVFSTLLWYLNEYELLSDHLRETSISFSRLYPVSPSVVSLTGEAVPFLKDIYQSLSGLIERISETHLPPEERIGL